MNLKNTQTIQSKQHPDVSFKVRVLNLIQRARRDAEVATHRIEYTRLQQEIEFLSKSLLNGMDREPVEGESKEDHRKRVNEELRKKLEAATKEERHLLLDAEHRANLLLNEHLIPAAIKAALIDVTGLADESGQAVKADKFLEVAPDALIVEAYEACESASGLSGEDSKN